MKNKKLFAILTLVCFMFTLMPVAAFAAAPAVGVIEDDELDQSITVTEDATVDFVVDAPEVEAYTFVIVEDDELYATTTGAYTFEEVGTYTVYAVGSDEVSSFINDGSVKKAVKWELIQEKESFVDDVLTVKVKADSTAEYVIELNGANVDEVAEGKYAIAIAANNGWNDEEGEMTATLTKDGEAVKGADLTFSVAGYVDVITEDGKTTDRAGDVDFEVVSDRTGEYKVIVKYGTKAKAELAVTVQAETVGNVSVVNAPKAPVDKAQGALAADIEFKFVDANGRAYAVGYDVEADEVNDSRVKLAVTEKPADSNVDENDFALIKETAVNGNEADEDGVYTLVGDFDEEGEYTFKVTLKNGKSASATVKVMEQGDIVGIKYDVYNTPATVAYGAQTAVNKVLAYDANGVTSSVAADATFSANGVAIEKFNKFNHAVAGLIDLNGGLIVKADDDFIGSKITVMAEYEGFTATTVLTVVDVPTTITFGDANAEVGVNTEIKGTVVDANGNRSSIANMGGEGKALVLDKPENAVAVADVEVDAKGNVILSFLASEEGEYKVQVAVTYGDDNFVSGIATIVVGAGEGTFEDVVVMSIGANNIVVNSDVKAIAAAPMIQDGRTFVPFRALAEAFGAEVEWVEATQSVVAELNGVKVVMVIGSNEYTVNGVAKTADVAPFINGASTMVPVRFVAEAFGINVTPIAAADGTIADVMFAK